MCAIPQLVSAPLNPIPTVEHFRRSHPQCEHSYGQHIYMSEENNAKQDWLLDMIQLRFTAIILRIKANTSCVLADLYVNLK